MDAWTASPVQAAERISAFLWKVYAWMCIGLALTAVVAYTVSSLWILSQDVVEESELGSMLLPVFALG